MRKQLVPVTIHMFVEADKLEDLDDPEMLVQWVIVGPNGSATQCAGSPPLGTLESMIEKVSKSAVKIVRDFFMYR